MNNSFAGINVNDPETKDIFQEHAKQICPEFKTVNESSFIHDIQIIPNHHKNIYFTLYGKISLTTSSNLFVKYTAANPPTYNSNFSGSGLPYPNEEIAYQNTPNRGNVQVTKGQFIITLQYPNSYYINMGSTYIAPHIKLLIVDEKNTPLADVQNVNLGNGIPFRTLTWPSQRNWNEGPLFYKNDSLPVRTQNQILLDYAYPSTNEMPSNFWGTTPSH